MTPRRVRCLTAVLALCATTLVHGDGLRRADVASPVSDGCGTASDVLGVLYNALVGPAWRSSSGWLSGNPCRGWYGIDCEGDDIVSVT